jgi:hypothetical protein
MSHVRFYYRIMGGHVHIDVHIGVRRNTTHGKAGALTMTKREFRDWQVAWGWSQNRGEAEFVEVVSNRPPPPPSNYIIKKGAT